jgi:hypothetical protein
MKAVLNLFKKQPVQPKTTNIALVCNHSACALGQSIYSAFTHHCQTVGVAHAVPDGDTSDQFEAYLNEEEERARLIAYLKHHNYRIQFLVYNQPFKLVPTIDEPLHSENSEPKESKVEDLKQKVRILLETPLFTVSDLQDAELFTAEAQVLILQHP